MPTYGYQCNQCAHEFSVFQAMKDDPIKICPECSGTVKRLLYPVGIVFKGSGWYVNDSRKPDTSPDSGNASDTGNGNEKKADGKTTDGKLAESTSKESKSTENSSKLNDSKASESKESKPSETKSDPAPTAR